MPRSRVKDDRRKFDTVLKQAREMDGVVTIGVHGDSPSYVRGQGEPATGPQVAAFNEFGTLDMYGISEPNNGRVGVPERSFIRSTVDAQQSKYRKVIEVLFRQVLMGEQSKRKALGIIGAAVKADIQQKIVTLRDPPNAERTIEAKGSSNPLINDGQLKNSITWRVRE